MQTIVNLGTGGADLNGQNGSTTSADSNDALFLDWPGDNGGNYVYVTGDSTARSCLIVGDAASLDITGDIDIRLRVACDDWTPASTGTLLRKGGSSSEKSYWLLLYPTGTLLLLWSENGTAHKNAGGSSDAVSFIDGQDGWIRATLDVDNGSGEHVVKYYTSTDGATWTQLGPTRTGSGTTSIYSSTTQLTVGARSNTVSEMLAMKVYRAQVLDGIDGTAALDIDTSVITSGADTTFSDLTGSHTVTINRYTAGRKSVAVVSPVWLFGTDDYMEVADNDLLDFGASDSFTVLMIIRQWANTISTGRYLSKRSASGGAGYLAFGSSTSSFNLQVSDGVNTAVGAVTLTLGDLSIAAYTINRASETMSRYLNGSFILSNSTAVVGDLSNGLGLYIGRVSDAPVAYQDFELISVAVFRRALTATEIAAVTSYYQARLS